jgi:hypothetical protein
MGARVDRQERLIEMATDWLPLTEYSSKYQVSISTLRRRIKADDIKYLFKDGRYLISDQPQEHRPSLTSGPSLKTSPVDSNPVTRSPALAASNAIASSAMDRKAAGLETVHLQTHLSAHLENRILEKDEPILTAANRLLTELKRAYTQILHEKEEQILHLKGELANLKTLVRVLEAENDRLNQRN